MYKKIIPFFLSCVCLLSKHESCAQNKTQKGIIEYQNFSKIGEGGLDTLRAFFLKMIPTDSSQKQEASQLIEFVINDMLNDTSLKQIILNFKPNDIFRITKNKNILIDAFRITKTGILPMVSESDTTAKHQPTDLFKNNTEFQIKEYSNDVKEILGFNCHKVILTIKERKEELEQLPFSMGDDIFEMYVTDKIDLPVHTILLVGVSLNGMFPLKIKRFSSNLPMISEIYQAVKVIKL